MSLSEKCERDASDNGELPDTQALVDFVESVLGRDQCRERFDNFRSALRQSEERWNDRFLPERENLCEAYIKGRFEIAIHGNLAGTVVERHWLLRIKAAIPQTDAGLSIDNQIDLPNGGALRRYDKLVVLVDTVQQMQIVERAVPSLVRLDFFKDQRLGAGEGLLYRLYSGRTYKVFPGFRKGKHDLGRLEWWPPADDFRECVV